jgi:hypothetical protein
MFNNKEVNDSTSRIEGSKTEKLTVLLDYIRIWVKVIFME